VFILTTFIYLTKGLC